MAVTDDNAKEGPSTAVDKTEHLDKVVQEVVEVSKSCIPVPSCSVVQVEEDDVSAQGRAEEDRILLDEGKVSAFFTFFVCLRSVPSSLSKLLLKALKEAGSRGIHFKWATKNGYHGMYICSVKCLHLIFRVDIREV